MTPCHRSTFLIPHMLRNPLAISFANGVRQAMRALFGRGSFLARSARARKPGCHHRTRMKRLPDSWWLSEAIGDDPQSSRQLNGWRAMDGDLKVRLDTR
jgi:hypothetical protein